MAAPNNNNRSFAERWHEWWHGSPQPLAPPPEPESEPVAAAPKKPKPTMQKGEKPLWEGDLNELRSHLWGEGNAAPTEADFCSRMYPQLGLNNTMTVLDVGDGLAGGAMAITKGFQAFVECYLQGEGQIPAATKLLQKNKVATKVTLHACDSQPQLAKRYHALSLRRALWRMDDPAAFMETASNQLREHARLVMTEYLVETPVLSLERVSKWFQDQQFKSSMSLGHLQSILEKNGFDVRVTDDITAQHRADIRAGLENLRTLVSTHQISPSALPHIMAEADTWAYRADLLDDGLRLYRFFAQRRR